VVTKAIAFRLTDDDIQKLKDKQQEWGLNSLADVIRRLLNPNQDQGQGQGPLPLPEDLTIRIAALETRISDLELIIRQPLPADMPTTHAVSPTTPLAPTSEYEPTGGQQNGSEARIAQGRGKGGKQEEYPEDVRRKALDLARGLGLDDADEKESRVIRKKINDAIREECGRDPGKNLKASLEKWSTKNPS
jgi:hypothetical protein